MAHGKFQGRGGGIREVEEGEWGVRDKRVHKGGIIWGEERVRRDKEVRGEIRGDGGEVRGDRGDIGGGVRKRGEGRRSGK